MQDETQNSGMERRMVHRLLMHWRSAQDGDSVPTFSDVLSRDLGDIYPYIYLLVIGDEGGEPSFERIGTSFAEEGTASLVGQSVSAALENTLLGQAVKYFERVLDKQIPITIGGEFEHANGDVILYRSIIMPARGSADDDHYLIGAVNCKVKDA